MKPKGTTRGGLSNDPLWYKDAVIYELRTRSYFDSNGDGIGDLTGLAEKLPYLQDLGVTALWLLPLCPSPGRDDGYDIGDYFDVHPDVGTVADLQRFIEAAHQHGIRVITELVLNHTSDVHPWFQRARRAPPGSPERDFYVWSDTPDKYRDARIIFKDFEPSNWSWDRVANAYYWHRFFSHQPDLNFENPLVQEALFEVCDFWFGLGVDGVRLDAVPYLFEEEGTNCENLPKTHDFLKRLRAHVDGKFENRMLLAEANQWPEDAAAYFGDGDECHMNFHFPIMPRMFMAIHMEDRFPIIDILAQTPQLHPSCQWAMFLRNHDELTLEMVTDEERDYMYRAYAHEQSMRINLGIRRRLAPLVGNDRRKMELLNGLLFALPGTPVLYYGDEIGMGDNVFLGDRNGVRTPMQWSADRNAGFSRANPQRLILPINIDPEYHYESLNVEAQQNNPNSLLWWTKRLVSLRKQFRAFGRGTIEFLAPVNARVLAFVREYEDETLLVVANLSRFVQYVELDLAKYKARVPTELFGKTAFPPVGDLPYLLTLGGHAFYWFSLERPRETPATRTSLLEPPLIEASSARALLGGAERATLEDVLPSFLDTRKWFRGHGRSVATATLQDTLSFGPPEAAGAGPLARILLVRVEYTEGESETYQLPVAYLPVSEDARPGHSNAVIAIVRTPEGEGRLVDALDESDASRFLLRAILASTRGQALLGQPSARRFATPEPNLLAGGPGSLASSGGPPPPDDENLEPRSIGAAHANAALRFGDRYILKVFRKVEDGLNPELELGRYLTEKAPGLAPAVAGALEYRVGRSEASTLAVLQQFVPNEGTAWEHSLEELNRFYERVVTRAREEAAPAVPEGSLVTLASEEPPPLVREVIGAFRAQAELLGKRTADLHLALAASEDPAFAPEPYSTFDRRSLYQSLRNLIGKTLRSLRGALATLPPGLGHLLPLARAVAASEDTILQRFEPLLRLKITGLRTRSHGDFHLGQVLWTGKDFVLLDFDGGGEAALVERRRKRSPLRDVAGMIRSFHYAAYVARLGDTPLREADRENVERWSHAWHAWIAASYLRGYLRGAEGATFLPHEQEQLMILVDRFVMAKALTELASELVEPSERLAIPLSAIAQTLGLHETESPRDSKPPELE